jgi:septin family protein
MLAISNCPVGSKSPKKARRSKNIRERAGRFRVLIIGRANAGKTTILQKVCNTTERPEIFDSEGKKVRSAPQKIRMKPIMLMTY